MSKAEYLRLDKRPPFVAHHGPVATQSATYYGPVQLDEKLIDVEHHRHDLMLTFDAHATPNERLVGELDSAAKKGYSENGGLLQFSGCDGVPHPHCLLRRLLRISCTRRLIRVSLG